MAAARLFGYPWNSFFELLIWKLGFLMRITKKLPDIRSVKWRKPLWGCFVFCCVVLREYTSFG